MKDVLGLLCSGGAGLRMMYTGSNQDNPPVVSAELAAFSPSKSAAAACAKVGLTPTGAAPPVHAAVVSAVAKRKPLALTCTVTWTASMTNADKVGHSAVSAHVPTFSYPCTLR